LLVREAAEARDEYGVPDPKFRSAIAVVLQSRAIPIGVATAYSSRSNSFDAGDVQWLDAAGRILALVIDLEQSRAESAGQSVELRRSNEDLEQFAFLVSHDLQEPLRTISGYSQLLLHLNKGNLDRRTEDWIGFIVDGTVRAQALIKDLLNYTRLRELPRLTSQRADCEAVLRIALMNLGAAITESAAQITHGALPTVRGDESTLAQVFENLVGNAIKYRGPSPPRVRIDAKENGSEWIFSVADDGIGIGKEYHELIFGVFKRLHGREISGTGIGLAICRKIVEGYGGKIWVASEAGKGSTFYFSLPGAIVST
jgi:light-regulated signal transduction histidine kinase (bacteriophytochrome)